MILSDGGILFARFHGELDITPFKHDLLQPASYDVTLDHLYRRPNRAFDVLDVSALEKGHTYLEHTAPNAGAIYLPPDDFILACTREVVRLGNGLVARVEGKSSLARLGLAVHVTAGFVDPGFEGQVTLEIKNLSPWTILLRAGMPIAQLAFEKLDRDAQRPYGNRGRYQGQHGPTESRFKLP